MNHILASVKNIQNVQNLNIVTFKVENEFLKMMSLELQEDLKLDSKVSLTFKSTSLAIAKNISGELSYSNQLLCEIISIEAGELLSVIKLRFKEFNLESIITRDSQKRMQLKRGDRVLALLKSSDLSIARLL